MFGNAHDRRRSPSPLPTQPLYYPRKKHDIGAVSWPHSPARPSDRMLSCLPCTGRLPPRSLRPKTAAALPCPPPPRRCLTTIIRHGNMTVTVVRHEIYPLYDDVSNICENPVKKFPASSALEARGRPSRCVYSCTHTRTTHKHVHFPKLALLHGKKWHRYAG